MKGTFLLFLTSIIWGGAFLFQKTAMENISPFYFNGLRFLLGSLVLFPFIFKKFIKQSRAQKKYLLLYGIALGIVLFFASCLQQLGIFFTTVNKSSFITALYICMVPFLGIYFGIPLRLYQVASVFLAAVGFYFLTISQSFSLEISDTILLAGAFFWALHIILIDNFVKKINQVLLLAFFQFFFSAILSLLAALVFEEVKISSLRVSAIELFFTGVISVAIAYSLQIKAQSMVKPVYASLVFSTEAIFASLFACFFLAEKITTKEVLGSLLIFFAIIICQIPFYKFSFFNKKLNPNSF